MKVNEWHVGHIKKRVTGELSGYVTRRGARWFV